MKIKYSLSALIAVSSFCMSDTKTTVGDYSNASNLAMAAGYAANAKGTGSVAIGANSMSSGQGSIAIGASAETSKDNSVAIGQNSKASAEKTTAVGNMARAYGKNSIAIGENSIADDDDSVSFGDRLTTRRVTRISDGVDDSDAVTKRQLDKTAINSQTYTDSAVSESTKSSNQYTDTAKREAIKASNQYTDNRATEVLNTSRSYTDGRVNALNSHFEQRTNQLESRISRTDRKLSAGIAGVTAIASIPYLNSHTFSYGIGVGNYRSGNALAAGIQLKLSNNLNARINISLDTEHNTISGAGIAGGF